MSITVRSKHPAGTAVLSERDGVTLSGASPYLVLGTLDSKTWREGMSGSVAIQQVRDHMADFKAYMRVDITPRHWSRRD